MHPVFVPGSEAAAPIPIWFVTAATDDAVRRKLDAAARAFASAAAFEAKAGRHLLLPGADGLAGVLMRSRAIPTASAMRLRSAPSTPSGSASLTPGSSTLR